MNRRSIFAAVSFACAGLITCAAGPVRGQSSGPMQPPSNAKLPVALPPNKPEPPPIPPDVIIQRAAAKEDQMLRAFTAYGYQKSMQLAEIGPDNKATGQLEIVTQAEIGPDGKRYEKQLRRTQSTLKHFQIERGDPELLRVTPPFPLTTSQLPKYDVSYEGKQPLDELSVYIFAVKPHSLDRTHYYFSGVIWVDVDDLVIVKTIGKWVSEMGDLQSSVVPFTVFETQREQVGKNEWFPSYARADSSMTDGSAAVPIRMIVRWTDYKLNGSNSTEESPTAKPSATPTLATRPPATQPSTPQPPASKASSP